MRLGRCFAMLGLVLLVFLFSRPALAEETRLKIIYCSTMPGVEVVEGTGGLAELATMVERARASEENVLFLHGGASLAPSAISSFDRGAHMVDILNSLEPDAMAMAKREFAYREDELTLRSYEAAFPFLCANVYDPGTQELMEGLIDHECFEVGPYKVCVFALIDPELMTDYRPDRIKVRAPGEVIANEVKDLSANGADLVILMADYDLPETERLLHDGLVDIILLSSSTEDVAQSTEPGLLVKQGGSDGDAAELELTLTGKGNKFAWNHKAGIVATNQFPPSQEVKERIQSYVDNLAQLMDTAIGCSQTPLDTTRQAVRTRENAFANLAADAIRLHLQADIALINGGGIRGNRVYKAGSVLTRRDIHNELPFLNVPVAIKVTGEQVLIALENGFSRIEEGKGRFPHVSGMKVIYAPTNPAGQRVRSVVVHGKPLKKDSEYTMATLDFLAKGGDGYTVLKKSRRLAGLGDRLLFWEIVRTYIQSKGTVAPRIEGRLVVASK